MKTPKTKSRPRGFAAMSIEQRRAIARLGGQKISRGPKGRARMAAIGRIGGERCQKSHKLVKRGNI